MSSTELTVINDENLVPEENANLILTLTSSEEVVGHVLGLPSPDETVGSMNQLLNRLHNNRMVTRADSRSTEYRNHMALVAQLLHQPNSRRDWGFKS